MITDWWLKAKNYLRNYLCEPVGSGGYNRTQKSSINLVRFKESAIGVGYHRCGWPEVLQHLSIINNVDGIILDDFVEQTFCYNPNAKPYKSDWVGIFHHPPNIPYFGNYNERPDVYIKSKAFMESIKHLKLAITLSEHLAKLLRKLLPNIKVVVIKHPMSNEFKKWTPAELYTTPKLIHVGFYMRNTQILGQFPPSKFKKIRLWNNNDWVKEFDERVKLHWKHKRENYDVWVDQSFVLPSVYDKYLSEGVIITEYFDASATNGVLDCIVRNTPIIVNRHPAIIEYLGEDYPLYFDSPYDIPHLLKIDKILEANKYLEKLDKHDLSIDHFVSQLQYHINNEK